MSTPLLHQGDLLRKQHNFITPSYGIGVHYVIPNDVADVAMVVLLDRKNHRNTIYQITEVGPTIDAGVAKLLTEHYGTDIEHIEFGHQNTRTTSWNEDFLTGWSETRQPLASTSLLRRTLTTLEKLTGKKPETFNDYLGHKKCA
jgi:hypothetical protein